MSEINVVPYIDVMLVMLVIFMITAPLLNQGVEVDLPQVSAEPLDSEQNKDPLQLSVDVDGNYYLNIGDDPTQPIDAETLVIRAAALIRQRPDVAVLVYGDENVDYGKVIAAMALLQQAGAPSVGLVTEPVQTGG
jgi:biopolymer transport protein TolR